MSDADEWITIAEAARRIQVQERSLRRVIARPPYADRTRQEIRTTRTGTRQAVLLPSALIPELEQHFEIWKTRTEDGQGDAAGRRQDADRSEFPMRTEPGLLAAYERMLSDKDAEIARLSANLQSSQEALCKALDALAREQTLRAIAAAPSEETQEATGTRKAGGDGETPVETEKAAEKGAGRPWWQFWQSRS